MARSQRCRARGAWAGSRAAYLAHLRDQGLAILELPIDLPEPEALRLTIDAMRAGQPVIAQGALGDGRWHGRADVLRQVEAPSRFGPWSYIPREAKLARETRVGAVLQLCLYAHLLEEVQGVLPEEMGVVSPGRGFVPEVLRLHDFAAYYRLVKQLLERELDGPLPANLTLATAPEPVEHCAICRWSARCDAEWHEKDHLSLVANSSRLQRKELTGHGIETLAGLARVRSPPWPWSPERGSKEVLQRSREQARVQFAGREQGKPVFELLNREAERGLALLPEPDAADLFFDFEGDPFVEGGLEYLFGWVGTDRDDPKVYQCLWAFNRSSEKAAFERFMDRVIDRWKANPGMHIYHFASYEPSHLKILAGRHATRLDELDSMLRGGLFVDLLTVVRQAIRASVESYSIKKLEVFYGFKRAFELETLRGPPGGWSSTPWSSRNDPIPDDVLREVEGYNRDDCLSARALREWLEQVRLDLVDCGEAIRALLPRMAEGRRPRRKRTPRRLLSVHNFSQGCLRTPPSGRRINKRNGSWPSFSTFTVGRTTASGGSTFAWRAWTKTRLRRALWRSAASDLWSAVLKETAPTIDTPSPLQASEVKVGDKLTAPGETDEIGWVDIGEVIAIDFRACEVVIKKAKKAVGLHPPIAFHHELIRSTELKGALQRLAGYVAHHGLRTEGLHRAALDLLTKALPRVAGGMPADLGSVDEIARTAGRVSLALDHGVLPIQGPPGTGKTYTGAELILDLVKAGKRVGVAANSHKVIDHLLGAILEAAKRRKELVRCGHKDDDDDALPGLAYTNKNPEALKWITQNEVDVLGGTRFMWSREEFAGTLDVLVVDEAGQLSLADALAAAQAAQSRSFWATPASSTSQSRRRTRTLRGVRLGAPPWRRADSAPRSRACFYP